MLAANIAINVYMCSDIKWKQKHMMYIGKVESIVGLLVVCQPVEMNLSIYNNIPQQLTNKHWMEHLRQKKVSQLQIYSNGTDVVRTTPMLQKFGWNGQEKAVQSSMPDIIIFNVT